jgi:hypothetical protein
MVKVPVLVLLFAISVHGFAQVVAPKNEEVEEAYEQFKETFTGEFGQKPEQENETAILSYRPPVKLERWFFNADQESGLMVIGISDPGLDSLDARDQAVLRGLALGAFARKARIQNVSDNYYIEQSGSKTLGKFNSFTKFAATGNLGYEVINQQYTHNAEMLVLIKIIDDHHNALAIDANIELFQSETSGQLMNRLFLDIKSTAQNGDHLHATWMLKENTKSYDIQSSWNGQNLNLLPAKYKYIPQAIATEGQVNDALFQFDMKYGLWYAYINAMAVNMEQMEVFNSKVKFLDEKYDEQFQDLTRVVFTETVSFRLTGMQIQNNMLSVMLDKN